MSEIIKELRTIYGQESLHRILKILESPSREYKSFTIPKKNSSHRRYIYAPSLELKTYQYLILNKYLYNLAISKHSIAYVKGKNIIDNTTPHLNSSHFLRIDIVNFFDNIPYNKVKLLLQKLLKNLNKTDIDYLMKIVTLKNRFVQGTPTTPIISNIYFKEIDDKIFSLINEHINNPVYTRYSDDITISSTEFIPQKVLKNISDMLTSYGFQVNRKKTYFSSIASSPKITGVRVSKNNKGVVLTLGSKFKKKINQAIYYKLKYKGNTSEKSISILGMLSYIKMVEPEYYNKLNIKYSNGTTLLIDRLKEINNNEI